MSDRSRVLILEEDQEMRELISLQLQQLCHQTVMVGTLNDALNALRESYFDLLIISAYFSETSIIQAIEAIRKLKSHETLSILMLSQSMSNEVCEKLKQVGMNDILYKPFERTDLIAKVKTLIRRVRETPTLHSGAEMQNPLRVRVGPVELDTKSFDVFFNAERIHLTPSEFKLLHALAVNRGKVLSRDHLIALVQGEGIAVVDRAVDTHIFGLRKKLGAFSNSIETVRGEGYRVNE